MAYSSDINLTISESPKTNDPELFPDMVDIYNALHILAQWVNALKTEIGRGSGDESTKPWDAMKFDKWFYAPAFVPITKGNVITPFYSTRACWPNETATFVADGVILGASRSYQEEGYVVDPDWPISTKYSKSITCIAMNDAGPGEMVQCGVGPAILEIAGVKMGQPIAARFSIINKAFVGRKSGRQEIINDGKIYLLPQQSLNPAYNEYTPIGVGVANDAAMMFPSGFMSKQDYLPLA